MTLRPPSIRHLGAALVLAAALVGGGPAAAASGQGPAPAPSTTAPGTGSSTTTTEATDPAGTPPVDLACASVVHDPEALLAGAPALGPAVLQLVAAEVDLRLRVVDRLPDADTVRSVAAACPGWTVDGERPGRAAWLFVDPGHHGAALWYGAELRSRLGSRFHGLRDLYVTGAPVVDGTAVAALLEQLRALVVVEEPPVDPFGCDQLLWDPEGRLAGSRAEDEAFALQGEGGDVHARVEPPSDGDVDRRIEQLDRACPGWDRGGERPERQLVVIVQPTSRATGIWYGRWWDGRAEGRWQRIQEQAMNPRFRAGDLDGGLAAGLRELGRDRRSVGGADPFTSWSSPTSDADRSPGPPIGIFVLLALFVLALWGVSYLSWRSKVEAGETDLSWSEYAGQGSSGYRSSRRFGSSSRRSSGGGHRSSGGRRSSGGGRRSGGGSTRW